MRTSTTPLHPFTREHEGNKGLIRSAREQRIDYKLKETLWQHNGLQFQHVNFQVALFVPPPPPPTHTHTHTALRFVAFCSACFFICSNLSAKSVRLPNSVRFLTMFHLGRTELSRRTSPCFSAVQPPFCVAPVQKLQRNTYNSCHWSPYTSNFPK